MAAVEMDIDSEGDVHKPYSVEENIHQLNAMDKAIAQLMNHTATALTSLTIPVSPKDADTTEEKPQPMLDPAAQKETFRSATDSFLTTLHTIDVKMKRQILALEEAGIINLTSGATAEVKGAPQASLKPNGAGAIGNLDVGWLNSRGTKVEREMETELWAKARSFLEKEGENLNK
ncbi:mediator complex protein [Stachybotrys elegans]|uniref:Mediator of RNA polymerase II transcription subunit 11 n=1 Tax=Stachybotrys elegans TaxID=80388 RepID=A0A8K0WN08_9HYPO|nr:mediator complex protein [Stachybotrys elegans]